LLNPYSFKPIGRGKQAKIPTLIYTFKCNYNIAYIVHIEEYDNNIFVLKYHQKNHRNSKKKYSLVNSEGFLIMHKTTGYQNAKRVFDTVTQIAIEIYKDNSKASFAFMGAPKLDEANEKLNSQNINEDGSVANTQRFLIYKRYVMRLFSPDQFDHLDMATSSSYMLRSKNNSDLTPKLVQQFFIDYIEENINDD